MATTIQISEKLQKELTKRKMFTKQTYEEVIWALLEDTEDFSVETKHETAEARTEIADGKFVSLSEIKKRYGM